jgi:hypothetical protein
MCALCAGMGISTWCTTCSQLAATPTLSTPCVCCSLCIHVARLDNLLSLLLMRIGCEQVVSKTTAFLEAARAGHGAVCMLLLQRGANPQYCDAHVRFISSS